MISRLHQDVTKVATLIGVCGADGVRSYGGVLRAVDGGGVIESVLELPTETYLRGVVPRESPAYWGSGGGGKGLNALRAQAVAARSYALASQNTSFAKTCDTTECQVYGGMFFRPYGAALIPLHSANSDRAVAGTAGLVRVFTTSGAIARTEFGASSGGWTAGGVFPAVQDLGDNTTDNSGVHNPYHSWTFRFSIAQVQSALGVSGVRDMRVTTTSGVGPGGGKATWMTVYTATGSVRFDADTVRGPSVSTATGSGSPRTPRRGPRPQRWSLRCIRDLLGRAPAASRLSYWVGRMVTGRYLAGNGCRVTDRVGRVQPSGGQGAVLGGAGAARRRRWSADERRHVDLGHRLLAGRRPDLGISRGLPPRWVHCRRLDQPGLPDGARPSGSGNLKGLLEPGGGAQRAGRRGRGMLRSTDAGIRQLSALYRTMLGGPPSAAAERAYGGRMPERGLWTMPGSIATSTVYRARANVRFQESG